MDQANQTGEPSAPNAPSTPSVPTTTALLPADSPRWPPIPAFLFRFIFSYVLIYDLEAFLGLVCSIPSQLETWIYSALNAKPPQSGPYSDLPVNALQEMWHKLIPALWSKVPETWKLGEAAKQITIFPNGSGDTTYNYVEVAVYAIISLLAAALWTGLDFRRRNYARLHGLLRIYIRYVLAFAMIGYGMAKVIPLQMPAPDAYRLTECYGDSSPMGILWAFIGASPAYSVFAGAGETIAGLLLFWRKTSTLGAIVASGVMANVVALNFCYDVPVKLYSSHLLLQAIILIAPDLPRLATLLLTNRPVPPGRTRPLCARPWMHYTWGTLKGLLVLAYMSLQVAGGIESYHTYGGGAPPAPLYGLYTVEEQTVNGQALPPLLTDAARWREIIIGNSYAMYNNVGTIRVRPMDGAPRIYFYKLHADTATIAITPFAPGLNVTTVTDEQLGRNTLNYTRPDPAHLVITGRLEDQDITLTLKNKPLNSYLLTSRGFHWINEFPMNR